MARLARVIAPGFRRHVTQRGNRRRQTFFVNGEIGGENRAFQEARIIPAAAK